MTTYAEGDRLRITIEATVQSARETDFTAVDEDGDLLYFNNNTNANIELIERSDDPAKDDFGAVRASHEHPGIVYVRSGFDWWMPVPSGLGIVDNDSKDLGRKIGAVPGTSAAEAAKPREGQSESSDTRPISDRAAPRVFQYGDEIPDDVTAVRRADGDLAFRDGNRNSWAYAGNRQKAEDLFNDGIGWNYWDDFEYPLTEVFE